MAPSTPRPIAPGGAVTWDDAVRALRQAAAAIEPLLLAGILYWQLSTQPEREAMEPFVLLLDGPGEDPPLAELASFGREEGR